MDRIVVDGYGGDNAPLEIVKGCADALKADKDLHLVITGDESALKKLLVEHGADMSRVEIVHAPQVITMEDVPTVALKKKTDSSLVKALRLAKENDDIIGMVSAGSTGAVLAGALLIIGRIDGVFRPGIAPLMATANRSYCLQLDCGANIDSKPEHLAQFAVMGSEFYKGMCGVDSPRVGLLSNGTEDTKGDEKTKATFKLLKKLPINFAGNMEARDFLSGKYDVVISDGFTGNICLKSMEGTIELIMSCLKEEVMSSTRAKLGAALMKPALRNLKKRLDYTANGGATIIGCKKSITKSHGSAKANTIAAAIAQVKRVHKANLNEKITKAIQAIDWENLGEKSTKE